MKAFGRKWRGLILGLILLLVVGVFVIAGLVKQKAPAVPFTFYHFADTDFSQTLDNLGHPVSNWVELHYLDQVPVEKPHPSRPRLPKVRRLHGFRKGGDELFSLGNPSCFLRPRDDKPVSALGICLPEPPPKEPWRLLLQFQGDINGRSNRLKAFVRTIGEKCGFDMAKAEWLDTKVWVDIRGRP